MSGDTFPLIFVSTVAMLAAVHLDPWGKRWECAVLFLVGASGLIWAVAA